MKANGMLSPLESRLLALVHALTVNGGECTQTDIARADTATHGRLNKRRVRLLHALAERGLITVRVADAGVSKRYFYRIVQGDKP